MSSTLDALVDKHVDIVIVDTFNLAHFTQTLKKKQLRIMSMIDTMSGYGIVLGGNSTILMEDIKAQLLVREAYVTQFIATKLKKDLPVRSFHTGVKLKNTLWGFSAYAYWYFVCVIFFVRVCTFRT